VSSHNDLILVVYYSLDSQNDSSWKKSISTWR